MLELRRGPLEKDVVFEAGAPIHCSSNLATETLGRFMIASGKLSEADFQTTLTMAAMRGVSFEEILTDRQIVSPSDLFRLLQQNLGRKLLDAFSWRSGSYRLRGDVPLVDTPLRVKVPQLLITGITKFEQQERIEDAISGVATARLGLAPAPLFPLEDLKVGPDLARVIEALRSGGTIEEIAQQLDLAQEELNRYLYPLLLLGAVSTEEASLRRRPTLELELESESESEPIAAAVEAPFVDIPRDLLEGRAPEPPPLRSVPAESSPPGETTWVSGGRPPASRDELLRMYLSFRKKDAFGLLDVPEDVSAHGLNRAYLRLAEIYLPSRFSDRDSDGLRDKAQEIFLALSRAYAELWDDSRRAALVEKRARKREDAARTAAKPSAHSGMVDPEMLYRQGRELVEQGKLREALSYLEMAADWDAQNCVYLSELAYCRFQLLINNAAHTLKTLKNAARIDPNCGVAYYYTGKIHATLGNRLEAEGYLRKAASLMPRDRRPADAIKSLVASK